MFLPLFLSRNCLILPYPQIIPVTNYIIILVVMTLCCLPPSPDQLFWQLILSRQIQLTHYERESLQQLELMVFSAFCSHTMKRKLLISSTLTIILIDTKKIFYINSSPKRKVTSDEQMTFSYPLHLLPLKFLTKKSNVMIANSSDIRLMMTLMNTMTILIL